MACPSLAMWSGWWERNPTVNRRFGVILMLAVVGVVVAAVPAPEANTLSMSVPVFCHGRGIYGPFDGYSGGTEVDTERCEALPGTAFWHFF